MADVQAPHDSPGYLGNTGPGHVRASAATASHNLGLRCLSEAEPTQIAMDSLYSEGALHEVGVEPPRGKTKSQFALVSVGMPAANIEESQFLNGAGQSGNAREFL